MKDWNWNKIYKIIIIIIIWALFLLWITWFSLTPISNAKISNQDYQIEIIQYEEPIGPENPDSTIEPEKIVPFYTLTEDEYNTVCYMVAGEAGAESYEGKKAVATCILNACELENMVPSEIRTQYQYSGWKTNLKNESEELWAEVEQAVYEVFYLGKKIDENILYFYNPEICTSSWHESMNFIMEVDGHRFFGKN